MHSLTHHTQFSHGVRRLASHPCNSWPPRRHSLCMGIGSHGSCFFLVSLPISFPIHSYVTMWFAPHVCIPPHLSTTTVPACFPHLMLVPFVQPLTSVAHIEDSKSMYVSPVRISTSIHGHSPTCVRLKSSAPFDIFRTPEAVRLSILPLLDLRIPRRLFPWYLRLCDFPTVLGERIYLPITRNTWTMTEGQRSTQAEASVQNPLASGTTRSDLRVG